MDKTKPFNIPKGLFVEAYKLVRANSGAAGVDHESLEDFRKNWKSNLYKLWNRMSSGSYFPPPVKAVPIPKKSGGERILGVPTVGDRICQTVVKLAFEAAVEVIFCPDSYGYRPNKSALDAIGVTRQRCWKHDYVLEFDIKGMFDNLPHDLLMKAVCKHTQEAWVILSIKRWLKAPMQMPNGEILDRTCGVPQGGVISPILSNLFLHYAFDVWMNRHYPAMEWCRYADDGLVHCDTLAQAKEVWQKLEGRFAECGLQLHPEKTRIVYCKDSNRTGDYPQKSFDFLGYTFRGRMCKGKGNNKVFTGFTPAVSRQAMKLMRSKTRQCNWRNRTDLSLEEIARGFNPILQGWLNYYGHYTPSALSPVWRHVNCTLIAWAMKKYKPLRYSKRRATLFLERVWEENPRLFAHWRAGMKGAFA